MRRVSCTARPNASEDDTATSFCEGTNIFPWLSGTPSTVRAACYSYLSGVTPMGDHEHPRARLYATVMHSFKALQAKGLYQASL